MPDGLNTYKSTLTPQQVDEALKRILEIDIPNIIQKQDLFDMVYPVGSIYTSVNNVSPQTFLGGTWQQIQGQFLLASSSRHPAGSTGGTETVSLTDKQNGQHSHELLCRAGTGYTVVNALSSSAYSYIDAPGGEAIGLRNVCRQSGEGEPHENMPPYLAVYMWKRTA